MKLLRWSMARNECRSYEYRVSGTKSNEESCLMLPVMLLAVSVGRPWF